MDVADLAGVSQSAVSRAFTPGSSVSETTRAKVVEAARVLGYRPNLIARSLITRRSNMIGVAMGYLNNQFYPEVLEALSRRLQHAGFHLLLFTADPARNADPILEEVLRYRVDALILASTSLSSALADECGRAGVPVVLFNRTTNAASVSSVTGDNEHGARVIAGFLAASRHRRFAYVAGLENASTNRDREKGYTEWLLANGFGPPTRAVGHYSFEGAMAAARQLFARDHPPDAVFCANDHMSLAVIEVARSEFGLAVPEDVSIVGFDDVGAARWPSYGLTSYAQPVDAMVDETVSMLHTLIDRPDEPPRRTVVAGDLVVRTSARLPNHGLLEVGGRSVWRPH